MVASNESSAENGENGTPLHRSPECVNLLVTPEKDHLSENINETTNLKSSLEKLNSNDENLSEEVEHVFVTKPTIVKYSAQNGKSDNRLSPFPKATENEKGLGTEDKKQKGLKRLLGIFLALVAALNFSLSALVIKILGYHPFNLGVWRFAVMTLIPIPFLVHAGVIKKQKIFQEIWPARSTTVFLMVQAVLGANSIIFVFFGFKYLNIADSIVIGTSAPVFVTLFAFIFLGEKCGLVPVLTAFLALIGVAIISQPPILTGEESINEETMLGVASSFSSMILLTICYVVIRHLRKVHHALVNLCFAMWGLLQSIVVANIMGVFEVPKNMEEVGLIILTAFLAFCAQTCITLALKYEQAGPVALVRTSEVVFAFLWQAIFLGVEPNLFSIIGAVVTLSGVVLTIFRKMVMSLPEGHKNRKRFRFLLL